MLYNKTSGRCCFCNADALWGDAPHKRDCSYYIFYHIVQDCLREKSISINVGSKKRRKAIINIFKTIGNSNDSDWIGAQEASTVITRMIKHYMSEKDNKTTCGILLAGEAGHLLATDNALEVSCEQCVSKEKQAHLELRNLTKKGMFWQQARALVLYWQGD